MKPTTILITRHLSAQDSERLREKLRELWPGETWTILYGELATARPNVGPTEWKDEDTDATPVPRFVE